jgi:hypothetical protein
MEREHRHKETAGWDARDAVPRDGPAVFVADRRALDAGIIHGQWVNPLTPPDELRNQLRTRLGHEAADDTWTIIDQVGLGQRMIDENPGIAYLPDAVAATFDDGPAAS